MLSKPINRSSSKSREKDKSVDRQWNRYSEPEPVFMSDQQLGAYLTDLRSHKPSRPMPTGARPAPQSAGSSGTVESLRRNFESQVQVRSATTSQSPIKTNGGTSPKLSPGGKISPKMKPSHGHSSSSGSPTQTRRISPRSHHRPSFSTSSAGGVGGFPNHAALRSLVSIASGSEEEDVSSAGQNPQTDADVRKLSGARWMEKQEARSIRLAMQAMDLKGNGPNAPVEEKVHNESELDKNAKEEAEELIRNHQQGKQILQKDDIKSRKIRNDLSDDSSPNSSRVPSDGSNKSDGSFVSCDSSPSKRKRFVKFILPSVISEVSVVDPERASSRESNHSKASSGSVGEITRSRSNSGSGLGNVLPLHVRNPFSRARNARQSAPAFQPPLVDDNNRTSMSNGTSGWNAGRSHQEKVEIQHNPPTKSKDPAYVTNTNSHRNEAQFEQHENPVNMDEPKMKDGLEVRGEDIRKATSKSLKDRSPKLPTPTAVSSKPGRPIVSFQGGWEPQAVNAVEGSERPLKYNSSQISSRDASRDSVPRSVPSIGITSNANTNRTPIPIINLPTEQHARHNSVPSIQVSKAHDRSKPPMPVINLPGEQHSRNNSVPSIQISSPSQGNKPPIPIINLPDEPRSTSNQFSSIPTISVSPAISQPPTISVSAPSISVSPPSISINSIPTINLPDDSGPPSSTRPLPTPKGKRHSPRKSKGYGPPPPSAIRSAASATPSNPFSRFRSNNALCTACALPIGGRIVTAAGSRFHPDCFRCFHCSEGLECVAFFPEPEAAHAERLERIRARQRGQLLPQHEQRGKTEVDDGDETQVRFYCHLDFHEFYSPRCKNCTTPIEGEVIVALGATWHAGHFFCAQCGDPFEASTPFVEKDGYAWCINCHTTKFSGKCTKCKRPVSDVVVQAMDREWHEECFCCAECEGPFEDGRYFVRHGDEDEPVCSHCEAMRLKA